MVDAKTDYVLRALSKLTNKRWELYIVSRILHRLDDPEIEFVCQQCVRKSENGGIALLDLFFPQFGLYLEVDEGHHKDAEAKVKDALRRLDIYDVTGVQERRISVTEHSISEINRKTDEFISLLKAKKAEAISNGAFQPWEEERYLGSDEHREAGFLQVGPRSVFLNQRDALQCFGYKKGHFRRAVWKVPREEEMSLNLPGEASVWFPKLFEQAEWSNSLSEDGKIITETPKLSTDYKRDSRKFRLVMAHSKDAFGRKLYRFLGLFEALQNGNSPGTHKFKRKETRVRTVGKSSIQSIS